MLDVYGIRRSQREGTNEGEERTHRKEYEVTKLEKQTSKSNSFHRFRQPGHVISLLNKNQGK